MLSETILLIPIMPMFASKMANAVCHKMTKNGLKWSFYDILLYMAYGKFIHKHRHDGYRKNHL